jgi:hypothetical protein
MLRSMDSSASGSHRGTAHLSKSTSGDFNAVPKKISTPYPNAEFGTEGRHPAQSQSSIAKEEDLFHWQSMVRYAQPWNLYGQHLSRPLKRVIGQMTVPDVEDHKILDTNKVRAHIQPVPSPLPFVFDSASAQRVQCVLSMFSSSACES